MPLYAYVCPECGQEQENRAFIETRDAQYCMFPHFNEDGTLKETKVLLRRLCGSPSFVVNGFNAKNGYSGGK